MKLEKNTDNLLITIDDNNPNYYDSNIYNLILKNPENNYILFESDFKYNQGNQYLLHNPNGEVNTFDLVISALNGKVISEETYSYKDLEEFDYFDIYNTQLIDQNGGTLEPLPETTETTETVEEVQEQFDQTYDIIFILVIFFVISIFSSYRYAQGRVN